VTYERLKLAREAKGFSLEELARRSGIRPRAVELIERGEFGELPAGLYCRSTIRSYASTVGLDPDELVESLRPYLPVPEDPLDGLARRHGHARKSDPKVQEPLPLPVAAVWDAEASADRSPEPAALAFLTSAPVEQISPDIELPAADPAGAGGPPLADVMIPPGNSADVYESGPAGALELPPRPASSARHWWRVVAASAIDAALLSVMGAALVWLTALACGTTVPVALRTAAPAVALVFGLIVALYFVLFGGVGDATPGATVMRLDSPQPGRVVLNPRDVFGRARRSMVGDSSLLTE
jgi:transcriptional regulator with XRE-family HTH domain